MPPRDPDTPGMLFTLAKPRDQAEAVWSIVVLFNSE